MTEDIIHKLKQGDYRALAQAVSLVENEGPGYEELLEKLSFNEKTPIIGITGPPGAGKSTLINALVNLIITGNKKVAIIAVDPSSPFNRGAIMGDRIRMSSHFTDPRVFIRSMATRGSLGGLAPKIFEVADLFKASGFDYIIIETVGVGQSEVEIASLADITLLVLVPESGDEIQTLKSGVMEIADVFVVNKSDREGAELFAANLSSYTHAHASGGTEVPVLQTIATTSEGLDKLLPVIEEQLRSKTFNDKKADLLAEKAIMLIKEMRTKDISLQSLKSDLKEQAGQGNFNLYRYIKKYMA